MKPRTTDEYRLTVTVEEAGRLLGLSRGLACEAVRRHEIPSVKVGKRLLIPRAALEKFLAETSKPKE